MKKRNFRAPSGETIPFTELGFGAAPIGNLYRAIDPEDAQKTLEAAWKAGIRYYDTAPLYGLGLSETRLNRFLHGKKRSDYVLSTKVGRLLDVCDPKQRTGIGKFFATPSRKERYDYSYDGFMRSIEFSLERLGVDSIDIIFVHDVDLFTHKSEAARDAHVKTVLKSGYKALVKLRDEKVIKAFGAGLNEWQTCETLARAGDFDIFLLAGRYTLLGGPYKPGLLATGPRPGAWYNYDPAPKHILERVARIEAVCKRHKVKLAQAALRFPLHHPQVVSVIPGGVSPREVALNAATMSAKLPKALWKDLKAEGLLRQDAPVPR
jgi:D-threo-aldose 1-dehydrogenase